MDPLSITVSCVTLISTVTRASYSLTSLIREWRDASADLKTVMQELVCIQAIVESLMNHTMTPKECTVPSNLQHQIASILKSCHQAVSEIGISIAKHTKSRLGKSGYWAFGGGREDIAKHRFTLQVHKSALGIALDMVLIHVTGDIKNDTTRILGEIKTLRRRLLPSYHPSLNRKLKKPLDDMTCYTESLHLSSDGETQYSVSSSESTPDCLPFLHPHKYNRSNRPTPSIYPSPQPPTLTPFITFTPLASTPFPPTTLFLPSHTNVLRIGRASLTRHRGSHFLGLDSKVISSLNIVNQSWW
ncbi:wd40 yvtn repeat-like-containing domain protein [Stemphylium lycopersici]|nr:wd40 yvtn repeat-like-containing domain protein [Stemphylium lycopersici]